MTSSEIVDWEPSEETDGDLRRRIKLQEKKIPKFPSIRALESAQRKSVDGSWGMRKQNKMGSKMARSIR